MNRLDNLGIIKSEFSFEGDTLVHKSTQPTEDIILERNNELRKNAGVIADLGQKSGGGTWGRQVASIPIITYNKAIRDGYDLNNRDSDVAGREMHRFLQSAEGKMCLVR
jgi:hypothetical protein